MSRHHLEIVGPCVLAASAIALAACGGVPDLGPSSPVLPTNLSPPAPAAPSSPPFSVRGTALEHAIAGDPRPVPNLRLAVTEWLAGGESAMPDVITDENGRYTISGITSATILLRPAPESQHRFLCEAYPIYTLDRRETNLPLVPVTWSDDRLPPGMRLPGTSVYGRVTGRSGDVLVPLAGATVTVDEAKRGEPAATTNARGFYAICSIQLTDAIRTIKAWKDGYDTVVRQFSAGWDLELDLELAQP